MKKVSLGLALLIGAPLAGCSDANAPGGTLTLSFAGRSASLAARSPAVLAAPATAPTADALVITKVQVVVRKIELETALEDECEDEDEGTPPASSCEEIKAGPLLVDVPTAAGAKTEVSVQVPAGTYRELEFKIHKVSSDNPADADFRAAHPDFVGKSVRVTGTFNGTAFTFESDVTAVQELELDPPLVVTDGSANTNLTVTFSLDSWFRAADGSLIDPSTANKGGPNEQLVKNNIRRSLRAFEDNDHDGDDDHEMEHEGGEDHHSGGDSHDGDSSSGPGSGDRMDS